MTTADKPALILVDIQYGFDDIPYWGGERNNPDAELNAKKILDLWRSLRLPVFHVQHCSTETVSPLRPDKPGNQIKDMVKPLPGEPVIKKNVNSAFIGTDLKEQLDSQGIHTLVILGITTDHCVSTTTRMAGNFGYQTFLVSDATATFNKKGINGEVFRAELIHQTALASLNGEFATVLTTDQLISRFSI
jgi:nicotinamidase-related amidase